MSSLEAIPCCGLVLGADDEGMAVLDGALRRLGASADPVRSLDEALALLTGGAIAFLVVAEASGTELDAIVARVRLEPSSSGLPIVVLLSDRETADAQSSAAERAHDRLGTLPSVVLAPRAPAELLESQLRLLVELHRSRTAHRRLEHELGQARRALHDAADTNTALLDRARCALDELDNAQAQLVQAAKLAALGELVTGIAHEINNPLAFAISHLGNLRRGVSRSLARLAELDPEAHVESARLEERLEAVGFGLERIRSLIYNLQTFSRLDDGKTRAVNVPKAIATTLAILHHRTLDRIRVTTEFAEPETIHCQSSLINQCVMNLLVNAIDAIEPLDSAGCIHVSGRAEGAFYLLRVVDNGPGIAPDILGRIFEPFFTTKPEGKGTGLGLSIAASVVEKHAGTLELSAADGGGTQAVIRLPLGRIGANQRPAAGAG